MCGIKWPATISGILSKKNRLMMFSTSICCRGRSFSNFLIFFWSIELVTTLLLPAGYLDWFCYFTLFFVLEMCSWKYQENIFPGVQLWFSIWAQLLHRMGIATDLLPWKNTGKSPREIYDTKKLSWSFWPPKKYKYIKLYIDWWEKSRNL